MKKSIGNILLKVAQTTLVMVAFVMASFFAGQLITAKSSANLAAAEITDEIIDSNYWADYACMEDENVSVKDVDPLGPPYAQLEDDPGNGGTTTTTPKKYTIASAGNLAWIAVNCDSNSGFSGITFNVTADIDLSSKLWIPIGSGTTAFKGKFYGNGHIIKGVTFDSSQSYSSKALFACTHGALIDNLIVKDCVGTDANIVYSSLSSTTITNCASIGGPIYKSPSGITTVHCESDGTLKGGDTQKKDGSYIGTNNVYVEVEATFPEGVTYKDGNNEIAFTDENNKVTYQVKYDTAKKITSSDNWKILGQTTSDNTNWKNASLAYNKTENGVNKYTITSLTVKQYIYNNSTMSWVACESDFAATTSSACSKRNDFKLILTNGQSGFSCSVDNSSGSITAKYANQTAIKIEVTVAERKVQVNKFAYAFNGQKLTNQTSISDIGGAYENINGKYVLTDNPMLAVEITGISENYYATLGSKIVLAKPDRASKMFVTNATTSNKQWSSADTKNKIVPVLVVPDTQEEDTKYFVVTQNASGELTMNIYIYLRNINKVTINNASVTYGAGMLGVGSSTQSGYIVTSYSSSTKGDAKIFFKTAMAPASDAKNYLSAVCLTASSINSMGDTHLFESIYASSCYNNDGDGLNLSFKGACKAAGDEDLPYLCIDKSYLNTSGNAVSYTTNLKIGEATDDKYPAILANANDGDTFYANWILMTNAIFISNSVEDVLSLEVLFTNPYVTNQGSGTYVIDKVSADCYTDSTSINIPATYQVTIFDSGNPDNTAYVLNVEESRDRTINTTNIYALTVVGGVNGSGYLSVVGTNYGRAFTFRALQTLQLEIGLQDQAIKFKFKTSYGIVDKNGKFNELTPQPSNEDVIDSFVITAKCYRGKGNEYQQISAARVYPLVFEGETSNVVPDYVTYNYINDVRFYCDVSLNDYLGKHFEIHGFSAGENFGPLKLIGDASYFSFSTISGIINSETEYEIIIQLEQKETDIKIFDNTSENKIYDSTVTTNIYQGKVDEEYFCEEESFTRTISVHKGVLPYKKITGIEIFSNGQRVYLFDENNTNPVDGLNISSSLEETNIARNIYQTSGDGGAISVTVQYSKTNSGNKVIDGSIITISLTNLAYKSEGYDIYVYTEYIPYVYSIGVNYHTQSGDSADQKQYFTFTSVSKIQTPTVKTNSLKGGYVEFKVKTGANNNTFTIVPKKLTYGIGSNDYIYLYNPDDVSIAGASTSGVGLTDLIDGGLVGAMDGDDVIIACPEETVNAQITFIPLELTYQLVNKYYVPGTEETANINYGDKTDTYYDSTGISAEEIIGYRFSEMYFIDKNGASSENLGAVSAMPYDNFGSGVDCVINYINITFNAGSGAAVPKLYVESYYNPIVYSLTFTKDPINVHADDETLDMYIRYGEDFENITIWDVIGEYAFAQTEGYTLSKLYVFQGVEGSGGGHIVYRDVPPIQKTSKVNDILLPETFGHSDDGSSVSYSETLVPNFEGNDVTLLFIIDNATVASTVVKYGYGELNGVYPERDGVIDWSTYNKISGKKYGNNKTLGYISNQYAETGKIIYKWVKKDDPSVVLCEYDFVHDEYAYNDWTPESFGGYNESEEYEIEAITVPAKILLDLDGTYLTNAQKTSLQNNPTDYYVTFNRNNYQVNNIIPTRTGYTFAYWGSEIKDDSGNPKYIIYLKSSNGNYVVDRETSTFITDVDDANSSPIKFYAYWNIDDVTITKSSVSVTYDGDYIGYDGLIATFSWIQDINGIDVNGNASYTDNITVYYKANSADEFEEFDGDLEFKVDTVNNVVNVYATSLKYSLDSGSFYVVFDYVYQESDEDDVSSEYYLLNTLAHTQVSQIAGGNVANVSDINIIPIGLEFDDTVTKMYDGTNKVKQSISDNILDVDKDAYKVVATYGGINVSNSIDLVYNITGSDELKSCYTVPEPSVKGAITPYIIKLKLTGNVLINPTRNITLLDGYFSNGELVITQDYYGLTYSFDNQSDVATFIKTRLKMITGGQRTVAFSIKLNDVNGYKTYNKNSLAADIDVYIGALESRVYKLEDIALTQNENEQNNFAFDFDESSIVLPEPEGDVRSIRVTVKTNDGDIEEVATIDSEDKIVSIDDYNLLINTIVNAGKLVFDVDVNYINANFWLKSATCTSGAETTFELSGTSGNVYSYVITVVPDATFEYTLELLLTNKSEVSFEYGYVDGETHDTYDASQIATQAVAFTAPVPERTGLEFVGWYYYDSGDTATLFTNGSVWNIKRDITFYAVWSYTATVETTGEDVEEIYDENASYNLIATVNYATNPSLTYNYEWLYCLAENGTYITSLNGTTVNARVTDPDTNEVSGVSTLTVKNYSDSGFYKFNFALTDVIEYQISAGVSLSSIICDVTNSTTTYRISIAKDAVLIGGTMNKVYDGTNEMVYILKNTDTPYSELIGTSVLVKYSSTEVGATIVSITGLDVISASYNFPISKEGNDVSGTIVKRQMTISFAETSQEYTGQKARVTIESVSDEAVTLSNIIIETQEADAGTYGPQKLEIVSLDARVGKLAVELTNLELIIDGTIIITKKSFAETDIRLVTSKVYNSTTQNIDVYVFDELITTYYTLTKNDEAFTGAKDVSVNSGITFELNYPNYNTYTLTGVSFEITPFNAYVDIIATPLTKVYDGTVNYFGVSGVPFTFTSGSRIYTDSSKSQEVTGAFATEIKNSLDIKFEDKNAGNNIGLSIETSSDNFVITQNPELSGSITKKQTAISLKETYTKIYDGKSIEFAYSLLQANGAVNGETITSGEGLTLPLTFAINAGTYNLANAVGYTYDLVMSDDNSISTNYEITGLIGTITISRADVDFVPTTEYTYTAQVITPVWTATRDHDNENITDLFEITATENPVNVGTYSCTVSIKAEHSGNYNFTSSTFTVTVVAKEVTIVVNASKFFDGKKLRVNIEDNSILCFGDTFYNSYVESAGEYRWEYVLNSNDLQIGHVNKSITVKNKDGEIATTNYSFRYNVRLVINEAELTSSNVLVIGKYTYNGSVQTLRIKVLGNEFQIVDGTYEYAFNEATLDARIYRTVGESTLSPASFKYANIYTVKIRLKGSDGSNCSNEYSFNVEMEKIVITQVSLTKNKVYDGTYAVDGTVTSSDIVPDDTNNIKLSGAYTSKDVGESIAIIITFNNYRGDLSATNYELLVGSYVLDANLNIIGKISKRTVTFTYNNSSLYYTGAQLTLNVADFSNIANALDVEPFGGSVTFKNVVNAGTYSLVSEEIRNDLTVASSLNNYTLVFAGSVTIKKAEVYVSVVSDNVYTYDAESHDVVLTATASNGAINPDEARMILGQTYKTTTSGANVTPINYGQYYIYPKVNDAYVSNYKYIGNEYLTDKLTINQRTATLDIQVSLLYNSNNTTGYEYPFSASDLTNIVRGHILGGKISISPANYIETTYEYKTGGTMNNEIEIQNFSLTDADTNNVIGNYNIEYNIEIVISSTSGANVIIENLTYNATERINGVSIVAEYMNSGTIQTETITLNNQGTNVTIVGFYANNEDARDNTNALTSIKNAGEYYARVEFDASLNLPQSIYYTRFNVLPKTITLNTLTANGVPFTGSKVYDDSEEIVLDSSDIYASDKTSVQVLGTYYNGNTPVKTYGTGYTIALEIVDSNNLGNYILTTASRQGSISQRTLTITGITNNTMNYSGNVVIELKTSDSRFIYSSGDLVTGHVLSGNVKVTVGDVGDYLVANGENNLVITSGGFDVTSNYVITFDVGAKLTVNTAPVNLTWTAGNLTYNAKDRLQDIKNAIIATPGVVGGYTAGVSQDMTISFVGGAVEVKDADTYTVNGITSSSGNYAYTILSPISITIIKQDITVNLGVHEELYKIYKSTYLSTGYGLKYEMFTGLLPDDRASIELGTYNLISSIINNNEYRVDTEYLIENNKIAMTCPVIVKNYNITNQQGGIKLVHEELVFEEITPFTYNAQDHIDELVINFTYEGGASGVITKNNTTYGSIKNVAGVQLINAGDYVITVIVDSAEYNVNVKINKVQITSVSYDKDKVYDGTNEVKYSGNTSLPSAQLVQNDDVVLTATYEDYKAVDVNQTITFILSGTSAGNYIAPQNTTGKITPKSLILGFGNISFTYDANNQYTKTYTGSVLTLATNDSITQNTVKLSFRDNNVKTFAVSDTNTTLGLSEFEIKHNGTDVVTGCYEISVMANVTINAKEFSIVFDEFADDITTFSASQKIVTFDISGLDGTEKQQIMGAVRIDYKQYANGAKISGAPVNAGKYIASAVYFGSTNYSMVGASDYVFEIIPYVYNATAGQINSFSKEYATKDPELVQNFATTIGGSNYSFKVQYVREAGEDLGSYNYTSATSLNGNIDFRTTSEMLNNKFTIVKNVSNVVVISLQSFINITDSTRYYGLKNIGRFTLSQFTFTTLLKEETLNNNIINSASSRIVFNTGNVGEYPISASECSIVSDYFTNFNIQSGANVKLTIAPRTLQVSSTTLNNGYDKVYDGTNEFKHGLSYNFNSVPAEGELDSTDIANLGQVIVNVTYDKAIAGNRTILVTCASRNFNPQMKVTFGTINKLEVNVTVGDVNVIYGDSIQNAIDLAYSVEYYDDLITKDLTLNQLKAEVTVSASGSDTVTNLSSAGKTKVGNYQIVASPKDENGNGGNVIIKNTITSRVIVGKKGVAVSVTPRISRVQSENNSVDLSQYTITIDGVISPDVVSVASASYDNEYIGINKVVSFTLSGADSNNYSAGDVLGDILQKTITFNYNYSYTGCPVGISDILEGSRRITSADYDYYKSVNEHNVNSLPQPSYKDKGYSFVGWSLTQGGNIIDPNARISTYITNYSASVNLYAVWSINSFKVNVYLAVYSLATNGYDTLGVKVGNSADTKQYRTEISFDSALNDIRYNGVDSGVILNYPNQTVFANHHFIGYGVNNIVNLFTTTAHTLVDDVSIYVVYALDEYTVTINANQGVFSKPNQLVTYNNNVGTISLMYGQKLQDVVGSALNVENLLAVTRLGYSLTTWKLNNESKTVNYIANYEVQNDTSLVAEWEANKYWLTLNSMSGQYTLNEVNIENGWAYVNERHESIKIQISYDGEVPRLINAQKNYYTFLGYTFENGSDYEKPETWTTADNLEIFAKYSDFEYTLQINTIHTDITIDVKDANGTALRLQNQSNETGVYAFNVLTSYKVIVTSTPNAGYTFFKYTMAQGQGTRTENVYYFNGFSGENNSVLELTAESKANANTIELISNVDAAGYVQVQITDNNVTSTYRSGTNDNAFTLLTDETCTVTVVVNRGYELKSIKVMGTGSIVKVANTDNEYTFKEFTSNATIFAEYEAKDLTITIRNNTTYGIYQYDGFDVLAESNSITKKTGTDLTIVVIPNHGYTLNEEAFETTALDGVFAVTENNGKFTVVLSGFTTNGEFTLPYIKENYTATIKYAEANEVLGTISPVSVVGNIATVAKIGDGNALVDEATVAFGGTYVAEYLTRISIQTLFEKTGYELSAYKLYVNGEYVEIGSVDSNNNLAFDLEDDCEIFIIFERSTYDVVFKVQNSKYASVKQGNGAKHDSISTKVRFERNSLATSIVLSDANKYEIVGWYIENQDGTLSQEPITTESTIPAQLITGNTTYVAVTRGLEVSVKVLVVGTNLYEVVSNADLINFASIVDGPDHVTITELEKITAGDGTYTVSIKISYRVDDTFTIELAPEFYYEALVNGRRTSDLQFTLTNLSPDDYSLANPYYINLVLKRYNVTVSTNEVNAISPYINNDSSVGVSDDSVIRTGNEVFADINVRYGGTVTLHIDVNRGYTYVGQSSEQGSVFDISNDNYTLSNVERPTEMQLNYETTKYKVIFNTNHDEGIDDAQYTYYIRHDRSTFTDVDENEVTLPQEVTSPEFTYNGLIRGFSGWSISRDFGLINKSYLFDEEGRIYQMVDGVAVYGFTGGTISDTTVENGFVVINLYGTWYNPDYKLTIELLPTNLEDSVDFDIGIYFEPAFGFEAVYIENTGIVDYFNVAQNLVVKMQNTPDFDGYIFVGWTLDNETDLRTSAISFSMLPQDMVLKLHYGFRVSVAVEEILEGINNASVNNQTDVICMTGDEVTLVATAGEGFEFSHWLMNGVELDPELYPSTFTTNVYDATIYTAVFVGKTVAIQFVDGQKVTTHVDGETTSVGQTIKIYVDVETDVEYGYELQAITVSNETSKTLTELKTDGNGTYYEYYVTQADGELGYIRINSVVNAKDVIVRFVINYEGSTVVVVNNVDVTNQAQTYSYNQHITINNRIAPRYAMGTITINGVEQETNELLSIYLTQERGFSITEENIIEFNLQRLFWLTDAVEFAGDGTEDSPFLIGTAEELAYLAQIINNGELDQSEKQYYFQVVANIDLTNKFWVPIGTEENPFGGVFNLGHFRIYGTYHAEEYEVLSWNAYCYGVFGYITEDAKIITSTTAIQAAIIIGSVILGIAIIAGTVIFIIARKKKKKLQKHANNVSVDGVAAEDEYVDEESGEVYDDEPQDDGEYEDDSYDGEGEEEWQDEGEYEESDEPVEDDEMTNEDYMEQIDEKAKELDNVETPEAPKAFDVAEFVKNLSNENKLQPKQDSTSLKPTTRPKPPAPPKRPKT